MKILLVDDEPDILELLRYNFDKEGYDVFLANNGEEAIQIAEREIPDVIILDIMMPGMDGVEVCVSMREIDVLKSKIIVFLTGRGESYSEIAGLESGADDYITKPVRIGVLKARIKSLISRVFPKEPNEDVNLYDLRVSYKERRVYKGETRIHLPKKEFELFALLLSSPDKLFSRDEIFRSIWGSDQFIGRRTIDVHIRKIREKLGGDYIQTIRSIGYKIQTDLELL